MAISHSTPASSPYHRPVNAIVIGGSPCGLAAVGKLLEQHPHDHLLWVDPVFKAGRIGEQYREVPRNTKVELFINFATTIAPFRRILELSKKPAPSQRCENYPKIKGASSSMQPTYV